MNDEQLRISRIETHWNSLYKAHGSKADEAVAARRRLIVRYHGAVYRYLLGALKDAEHAEVLCNDFALKCMQGAFERAAPARGRFRDYVKKTLVNMVNAHWREAAKAPCELRGTEVVPNQQIDDDPAPSFDLCWKEELLNRTWTALKDSRPTYYVVLRARVEDADMTAADIAAKLATSDKNWTAAAVRKTMERARFKYAELLVDEVAASIETDSTLSLRQELETLNLIPYCRSALHRRETS